MSTHLFVVLAGSALLAAQSPPKPSADAKTPGLAQAAILTPEQAITVRRPSDLQFSPDGKRLAFTVNRPPKGTTSK